MENVTILPRNRVPGTLFCLKVVFHTNEETPRERVQSRSAGERQFNRASDPVNTSRQSSTARAQRTFARASY